MMRYLFAYNPTNDFRQEIMQYAEMITEWDNEVLYKPTTSVLKNDDFRELLYTSAKDDEMILGMNPVDNTEERVKFSDLYQNSRLRNVVEREDPGGDIRKYINERYGSRWSLDFRLFGTREPKITSFEPFSEESIREMSTFDFTRSDIQENSRYPTTGQMIEWGDRISDKWGVKWGAIGTLHFWNDHKGGFNGFVIYNANDEILEWAEQKWGTYWNDVEPEPPFMKPSEFDMYSTDGKQSENIIRMWWD